MRTLERLRRVLSEERLLRDSIQDVEATLDGGAFGPLAAAGPRTEAQAGEYELILESVLEGYLLHYVRGRVVDPSDPDLRLLCGDYLYAFGLSRLAEMGDLDAVGELAGLISLCAQAHATVAPRDGEPAPFGLVAGLWSTAALAVAAGPWPGHVDAKRAARDADPKAADTAHRAAADRARELDVEPHLDRALIAFGRTVEARLSTT